MCLAHLPLHVHCTVCNIIQVAGTGTGGSGGDGGPALAAQFDNPVGIYCDYQGNLLVTDAVSSVVRRIGLSSGNITTVIGTSGAGFNPTDGVPATGGVLSTVNRPWKAVADAAGNIYVVDFLAHIVRRVDAFTNTITTIAGVQGQQGFQGDNGTAVSAWLSYPRDIAVDSVGNIYIADSGNNRVRKINLSGIMTTFAGSGVQGPLADDGQPALSAALYPTGVAVHPLTGLVYISEGNNCRVRYVAGDGTIHTYAGDAAGQCGYSGDGLPSSQSRLNTPYHISFDASGNLFIADNLNLAVRRVSAATGVIATIAARSFQSATGSWYAGAPAQSDPYDVALCPGGAAIAYVADAHSHIIYKVVC